MQLVIIFPPLEVTEDFIRKEEEEGENGEGSCHSVTVPQCHSAAVLVLVSRDRCCEMQELP